MGKAVIYIRVSDARQVDNTSLDGQEKTCREWCLRNGHEVTRVFVERGESAKSANRTEFQAMFRDLSATTDGSVSHVVVYKFDRFSRDAEDGAAYRMLLRRMGIALRSATEATDDSPAGKLLTTMLGGIAQFDNDVRAERTRTGMKNRFETGRWQWPAPTGYLTGSKSGPSLVPDPERAPHVSRLFELVATGAHTKASALAQVSAQGLRSRKGAPLTQETIRKILVNPLYMGEISIRTWGKTVRGDYAPLVSEETFDCVQRVLSGRALPAVAHVKARPDFPLRGLILCPDCGKLVTASLSTGKLGKKFGYYRCRHAKGHMNVSSTRVETSFVDLLERLAPKPERMALIERIFRAAWKGRIRGSEIEAAFLRRELAKEQTRKQTILERMADGTLDGEDFKQMNQKIKDKIANLRMRLALSDSGKLDIEAAIEYLTHILWNTSIAWQTSDLQRKSVIQRRMFPKGLQWSSGGFGTPVTHSIYMPLGDTSVGEAVLVAPQGFRGAVNKGDKDVFHIIPHAVPQTKKWDSYPD
jgi:site-specific DNA recombinase